MSGVGKTYLATMLRKKGGWFHYSGDYRIGSHYLDAYILDNIKKTIATNSFLHKLLTRDSVHIKNNMSFDNLLLLSSFLGKIGNPEQGALVLDEFLKRQVLYKNAETKAMTDVPSFISKAENSHNCNGFVNDAGGSLCELDDSVMCVLAQHTLLVYIKSSKENDSILIKRATKDPKPMYYNSQFLQKMLVEYLAKNNLNFVAQIDGDDFIRWVFPKLLYYRLPKYNEIAKKYGVTIKSDDVYRCVSVKDFLVLINQALDHKRAKFILNS